MCARLSCFRQTGLAFCFSMIRPADFFCLTPGGCATLFCSYEGLTLSLCCAVSPGSLFTFLSDEMSALWN